MIDLILAQAEMLSIQAVQKLADEAVQRDFKWWFAILFFMVVSAGTYIYKQQLTQLTEQRTSHDKTMAILVTYLREDHARAVASIDRITPSLDRLIDFLNRQDKPSKETT